MASYVGTISWGIVPVNWNSSNLATMSWDRRGNYLKSANDPLRYQIQWIYSGINEGGEVGITGGIVNVIFIVETSVDGTNWTRIGTIKKSRDIANKKYDTGTEPIGHRFTVDVSQLVADQLSYSLCPINKGTWQSNYYGGMNGGLTMQDNVIGGSGANGTPISAYNVSDNGTFRKLKVSATFEILDANQQIITADNPRISAPTITVINSVNQFEKDSLYYNTIGTTGSYTMTDHPSSSVQGSFKFLTRCFNNSHNTSIPFKKPVRTDEEAEFLQFFMYQGNVDNIGGSGYGAVGSMGLYVETFKADGSAENDFYVREFEDNAQITNNINWDGSQISMLIQNISPSFINNTALTKSTPTAGTFPYWNNYSGSKITALTSYYRVSISKFALQNFAEMRGSEYMYYSIDRENENIPYGYVRFYWLNSMGGTDSYTAKRDVVEGLTISRNVIERKSGDRTWYQADSGASNNVQTYVSGFTDGNASYISDTMRGGNLYKGGREVSSVNADRVQSVYTEPLNKSVAKWLEEMMLSPNVWIEMDTDATAKGNSANPYLRPSTKGYIPVIITNSDIEAVNQENGLVKFNIEYTLAHKVQTQRN